MITVWTKLQSHIPSYPWQSPTLAADMATNLGISVLCALLIIGSGHTSSSSDPPSSFPSNEGHEVRIVDVDPQDKSSFILHEEELAKVLGHEKCGNLSVSVISIAGDYRKGKSFLLNFILRYLRHAEKAPGKTLGPKWLEELPDAPVTGFGWKGGIQAHTTGLNLWSEPFVLPVKDKETGHIQDTCIVLMDTQGFFDHQNNMKNTAQIFALSSMMSSKTIYNVMYNLQENDLHNLEIFADYANLASVHSGEEGQQIRNATTFQDLLFLIRDWPFPYEYPYGFEGGQKYIDYKFNLEHHDEGTSARKNIRSYFGSVSGFLMPNPGTEVNEYDFDGRKSTLNPRFVQNVQELVHRLVSPEYLVKKRTLTGKEVTGVSLFEYFKAYFGIFKSPTLPTPMSILEATTEANNRAAATLAKDHYRRNMMAYMSNLMGAADPVQLEIIHHQFSRAALEVFDQTPKMGQGKNPEMNDAHRQTVIKAINDLWEFIQSKNQAAWADRIKGEHLEAIAAAVAHYIEKIGTVLAAEKFPYVESTVLSKLHTENVNSAMDIYNKAEKVGSSEDHETYMKTLMTRLGEEHHNFQQQNENYHTLKNQLSKWNRHKRKKEMEELKKQFDEELQQRLNETRGEGETARRKWGRRHDTAWNLLGSIASIAGLALTIAMG